MSGRDARRQAEQIAPRQAPRHSEAGPHRSGRSSGVPGEREADIPAGPAPGRHQAGPHPLGGSSDVPGGRGADITHLLYLHGFRSSPRSAKAQQLAAWMQAQRPGVHWWCPQLPPSPRDAIAQVEAGIADWPRDAMAVVGSSLGGFYATVLVERLGCPAALLNPAVDPARDLARHIGEQTAWHDPGERFFFRPEFISELQTLTPAAITRPERYFAIIAKGDEVLDWREMAARYIGAQIELIDGGDHAISDFAQRMPRLLRFLRLA